MSGRDYGERENRKITVTSNVADHENSINTPNLKLKKNLKDEESFKS